MAKIKDNVTGQIYEVPDSAKGMDPATAISIYGNVQETGASSTTTPSINKETALSGLPFLGGFMGGLVGGPPGTGVGTFLGLQARSAGKGEGGYGDAVSRLMGYFGQQKARANQIRLPGDKSIQPFGAPESYAETPEEQQQFEETLSRVPQHTFKGAMAGASDWALGKLFDWGLSKFPAKARGKGVTPKGVRESTKQLQEEVFKPVQEIIEQSPNKQVPVDDVLETLYGRLDDISNAYDDVPYKKIPIDDIDKMDAIASLIDEIEGLADVQGGNITLKQSQRLASNLGKRSFQRGGGTRFSSDIGTEELLRSSRAAGSEIRDAEIAALKELGIDNAKEIYDTYADLSKLLYQMESPVKGALESGVTAQTLGTFAPGIPGRAASAASTLAFMPYPRQLALQLLYRSLQGGGYLLPKILGPVAASGGE